MGEEEEEEREEEEEEDVFYKMLGFWGLAYCKWFNVAKGMGGRRCTFFLFLKVETFEEKEKEDVAWLVWLDHHVLVKKKKKKMCFIRC